MGKVNTHLRWFRQALLAARDNWPKDMRPRIGACEYCRAEGHLTFESTRDFYYTIGNGSIPSHESHSHLCLKCALANDTRIKREHQRWEAQREYEMQRREQEYRMAMDQRVREELHACYEKQRFHLDTMRFAKGKSWFDPNDT